MLITIPWILAAFCMARFVLGCFVFDSRYLDYPFNVLWDSLNHFFAPALHIVHQCSMFLTGHPVPITPIRNVLPYCELVNVSCFQIEEFMPGSLEWAYAVATLLFIGVGTFAPTLKQLLKRPTQWIQQSFSGGSSRWERATTLPSKQVFEERLLKEMLRDEVRNEHRDLLREYEENARHLEAKANIDTLTGLFNRRGMRKKAFLEWYRSQRSHESFHIGLFDLDNFKAINDTFGHPVGDQVLQWTAKQIYTYFPPPCVSFRMGGEELGVIMLGLTSERALQKFDQCRAAIAKFHDPRYPDLVVTSSIGLLSIPAEVMPKLYFDEGTLFEQVDQLLYEAKNKGKNRVIQQVAIPPKTTET